MPFHTDRTHVSSRCDVSDGCGCRDSCTSLHRWDTSPSCWGGQTCGEYSLPALSGTSDHNSHPRIPPSSQWHLLRRDAVISISTLLAFNGSHHHYSTTTMSVKVKIGTHKALPIIISWYQCNWKQLTRLTPKKELETNNSIQLFSDVGAYQYPKTSSFLDFQEISHNTNLPFGFGWKLFTLPVYLIVICFGLEEIRLSNIMISHLNVLVLYGDGRVWPRQHRYGKLAFFRPRDCSSCGISSPASL